MLLRRVTLLLSAVVLVTACSAAASSAPATDPTVPVGGLPAPVASDDSAAGDAQTAPLRSTTTLAPEEQIGAKTDGNRVILIGDSVMASTSRRYTNDMCEALVPLGWQVELDAETGRFVPFGNQVLDKRLAAGWDASVILLGNNYLGDQDQYRQQLDRIVQRLSPNPVVLLTVTEFRPDRAEVNAVIFEMAAKYENVSIVDWATTTADDTGLTGNDGLHLTNTGRQVLAMNVALALGQAPRQPGKCLTTSFTDDSSGAVDGSTTTVRRTGGATTTTKKPSSVTSATTTTAAKPAATTTTAPVTTAEPTTTVGPVTT